MITLVEANGLVRPSHIPCFSAPDTILGCWNGHEKPELLNLALSQEGRVNEIPLPS